MGKFDEFMFNAPFYVFLACVVCVILPILAIVVFCVLWLLVAYGLAALIAMWIAGLTIIAWHMWCNK